MPIEREFAGKNSDGVDIERFILKNSHNITVTIINLGGAITSIIVPDKSGKLEDITLGYETAQEYETNPPHLGCLVGRVANRIAGGKFTLDDVNYQLAVNREPNHLHGGLKGFAKKIWDARVEGEKLILKYESADGEENYPGALTTTVVYELNDDNECVIDYTATTTKPTIVNLTNHAYFNLAGHSKEKVYDHLVTINADKFTPKNDVGIPTGEIVSVSGTQFDLRQPVLLKERIHDVPGDLGYDHNFCINGSGNKKLAARVDHEDSGRSLEVYTDQPGVQLYTGNFLSEISGKGGVTYNQHDGFCLETQNYPNAINTPNFPSPVLRPGQTYRHTCWYKFITNK